MSRLSKHQVPEIDARFKKKKISSARKNEMIRRAVEDILEAETYEAAARLVLTGLAEGAKAAGAFA